MRWRRRRRQPVDPKHGRDPAGKLYDGDIVRPPGWGGWADLLSEDPAGGALAEPTQTPPRHAAPGGRR